MRVMSKMSTTTTRWGAMLRGGPRLASVLVQVALALVFAWTAASAIADPGARTPRPAVVIESEDGCVAPPAEMRRQHPQMLANQKNRTVREGIRGERVEFKGCIACHASSENGSVVGTERNFCQSCHSFVAVKLDCFDCHQPAPARGVQGSTSVSGVQGLITPLPVAGAAR